MLQRLKYRFQDPELLKAALTHRSAGSQNPPAAEEGAEAESDNQRLEFLGDAVLDLVISDLLYRHQPRLKEGDMSRIRAGLVCETRLAEVARRLRLGPELILGPGEAQGGGREKNSVLADAVEALLGAIYLDGGLQAAAEEARRLWKPYLSQPERWTEILADYKTRLQEQTQSLGLGIPRYELVEARGPAHARFFTMAVELGGERWAAAEAGSKKKAERLAAKAALELLRQRVSESEEKP